MGLAQPGLELENCRVEGGVEGGRACLRADDGTLAGAGDLDPLALRGLARIAFVSEFDVYPDHSCVKAFGGFELLRDMCPEVIRDLNVPALDDDVHAVSLCEAVGQKARFGR